MMTIVTFWIAASYVLAIALPADQLRRPLSEWEAAGRDRRFWVCLTIVMGLHALGPYAAAAYFLGVLPRFRPTERPGPRPTLRRLGAAVASRLQRPAGGRFVVGQATGAQELALVAALLVFVSSLIHSSVIVGHFEEYWLFGTLFAVVTCLQALWTALICGSPLNRRILVAGAMGNAALVVVWAASRTIGVPLGPQPWRAEPVGEVDALSTLDELVAVILLAAVAVGIRGNRLSVSPVVLRLATALAGPLVIYSVLGAFGAGGHHH
jgi:hypothetical protein